MARLAPAAAGVPVYALGGIDATNAADFRTAGADGVAVMGAVMRADDPAAVVEQLLGAVA
ncbi:Thiamine-phosphate synthase [Nocardioides aquaticus]|uniref:Thiamine-phosphate synthase n=1 Tax=Nocardioides aquaticus TaxID=160826 RepID=A0ABX8EGM6_9ACTN|nr:Thiamine-phosphate synthase [Nocardioides aquaticus]